MKRENEKEHKKQNTRNRNETEQNKTHGIRNKTEYVV